MKNLSQFINESLNELSNILKNLPKNKEFIELLKDEGYDYTLQDPPTKENLIDGLCDYVDYFIYTKYGDKYEYYNINGTGWDAHWIIFDKEDNLYKDGYDYKGKSDWKQLKWFKNLEKSERPGKDIIKMTPELP